MYYIFSKSQQIIMVLQSVLLFEYNYREKIIPKTIQLVFVASPLSVQH